MEFEKILSKYYNEFNEETIATHLCVKKFAHLPQILEIKGLPADFYEFIKVFIKYPNYYYNFGSLKEYQLIAKEIIFYKKYGDYEIKLFSWNSQNFIYNPFTETYNKKNSFIEGFCDFLKI